MITPITSITTAWLSAVFLLKTEIHCLTLINITHVATPGGPGWSGIPGPDTAWSWSSCTDLWPAGVSGCRMTRSPMMSTEMMLMMGIASQKMTMGIRAWLDSEAYLSCLAARSSRPWGGRRSRTWGSCWSRTPGRPDTRRDRHYGRRHRGRHSHPRPRRRDSPGCSTGDHWSYDPHISGLAIKRQSFWENIDQLKCTWWGTGRWIAGDTKAQAKSDEKQCYKEWKSNPHVDA